MAGGPSDAARLASVKSRKLRGGTLLQGAAAASARKADVRLRKGAAAEVEQRDVTAAEGGQMCMCASEKATADAVASALAAQHLIGQVGQPHVRGRGLPRPPLDPRFEYSVLTGNSDCQRALLRYHEQIVACWAALSPGELGAGESGAIVQESWTAVQQKLARTGWRPNPNPKPLTPYHDHPRRWRLSPTLTRTRRLNNSDCNRLFAYSEVGSGEGGGGRMVAVLAMRFVTEGPQEGRQGEVLCIHVRLDRRGDWQLPRRLWEQALEAARSEMRGPRFKFSLTLPSCQVGGGGGFWLGMGWEGEVGAVLAASNCSKKTTGRPQAVLSYTLEPSTEAPTAAAAATVDAATRKSGPDRAAYQLA